MVVQVLALGFVPELPASTHSVSMLHAPAAVLQLNTRIRMHCLGMPLDVLCLRRACCAASHKDWSETVQHVHPKALSAAKGP